ncbi:hypothetical protein PG990_007090 [Apiospora arundinis]
MSWIHPARPFLTIFLAVRRGDAAPRRRIDPAVRPLDQEASSPDRNGREHHKAGQPVNSDAEDDDILGRDQGPLLAQLELIGIEDIAGT